jgi:hypothetical protein
MGSSLTPDNIPATRPDVIPPGHDVRSLGPSDSSDSGSDMAGPGLIDADMMNLDRGTNEDMDAGKDDIADSGASVGDLHMDETSDRGGTGTRMSADLEPRGGDAFDIDTDRIVDAEGAGLGGGLDEAEEAQLGITNEDLDEALRNVKAGNAGKGNSKSAPRAKP